VEHEIPDVCLLSLVHHVVMLVNMKNVRWCDVIPLPFLSPAGKRVIVTFHNHGDRAACPVKKFL
jgi:hypothetical protein